MNNNANIRKADLINTISPTHKYSKEELIKLHEFTRENRLPPVENIDKDYFEYTSEDDPKYKFASAKYYLQSKLLLKALIWSTAIGSCFFLHRYYRKQNFALAFRWGVITWGLSFWYVWGSKELQPYVSSIYHAQMLQMLTKKDLMKTRTLAQLEQDINYFLGEDVEHFSWTWNFLKAHLLNENDILKAYDYTPINLEDKFSRQEKEKNLDDIIQEDFESSNAYGEDEAKIQYNFNLFKVQTIDNDCFVDSVGFTDKELQKFGRISPIKNYLIKNDTLSYPGERKATDILGEILNEAESFLDGKYKSFEDDPKNNHYF